MYPTLEIDFVLSPGLFS